MSQCIRLCADGQSTVGRQSRTESRAKQIRPGQGGQIERRRPPAQLAEFETQSCHIFIFFAHQQPNAHHAARTQTAAANVRTSPQCDHVEFGEDQPNALAEHPERERPELELRLQFHNFGQIETGELGALQPIQAAVQQQHQSEQCAGQSIEEAAVQLVENLVDQQPGPRHGLCVDRNEDSLPELPDQLAAHHQPAGGGR